jgi:hypothetical protein
MSWGYFVDLKLTMPSAAWKKVSDQKAGASKLVAGWSGLDDAGLEKSLGRPFSEGDTLIKVLKGKAYHGTETVHHVDEDDGVTTVRICLLLDKSTLELAYPLATLLFAARDTGVAKGALRLVNDGTAPGEDGVEIALAKKKLTKTKIEDQAAIAEGLIADLYGDLVSARLKAKSSKSPRSMINPFTGQPISSKRNN